MKEETIIGWIKDILRYQGHDRGSGDVTLFEKRVFADTIRIDILRWIDYPGLFKWTINAIICPHKREEKEDNADRRGGCNVTIKAEIEVMGL